MDFLAAIRVGMVNSINPCTLTAILVFFVYLYYAAKKRRDLACVGFTFITGMVFMKAPIDLTLLDRVYALQEFDSFINWVYILMAVAFLVLSYLLLRDWWVYKVSGQERKVIIKLPFMEDFYFTDDVLERRTRANVIRRTGFYLFVFSSGIMMSLLVSVWPTDYSIINVIYLFAMPGKETHAFLTYLVYEVANVWPMVLLLMIAVSLSKSTRLESFLKRYTALVQITFAAIFCGFGLTLLYILA